MVNREVVLDGMGLTDDQGTAGTPRHRTHHVHGDRIIPCLGEFRILLEQGLHFGLNIGYRGSLHIAVRSANISFQAGFWLRNPSKGRDRVNRTLSTNNFGGFLYVVFVLYEPGGFIFVEKTVRPSLLRDMTEICVLSWRTEAPWSRHDSDAT